MAGHPRMHYVILRSHRIQKHKFDVTCPDALFVESVPVPPEHLGMHYTTRKSHRMQKHKFTAMCPSTLFLEIALS
jgi:hypothetical protein